MLKQFLRTTVVMFSVVFPAHAAEFEESWESAIATQHPPSDQFFSADAGTWVIGDTVSEFPECGPVPHRANIETDGGNQFLRVISGDTNSSCSDNIWVEFREFPQADINLGFGIPITPQTRISFTHTSSMDNPEPIDRDNCRVPPCGDAIVMYLADTNGNLLAYILNSAPNPLPYTRLDSYRQISLVGTNGLINRNLYDDFATIPDFNPSNAEVNLINYTIDEHGTGDLDDLMIGILPAQSTPSLLSSILPGSRSGTVGTSLTVFATVINTGEIAAEDCDITLDTAVPLTLSYQRTDPATNLPIGQANTHYDLATSQSFVLTLTPTSEFGPTDVSFSFDCANSAPAPVFAGINTLLLSAGTTPSADVIALAATPSADGVLNMPGGVGSFSVASINIGVAAQLDVVVNTGVTNLPLSISLCQTDPNTGFCISNGGTPQASPLSVTINNNESPTFSVFVSADEAIALDPATNRIYMEFVDGGGVVRGATSVAVTRP